MIVARVAPLGRRNSPSTACGRTLDEACALLVRPRSRFDMPKLLSIVPAQHGAATTQTPRGHAALAGERRSQPGSLSVTTTDALFAGKVQRKVKLERE
jgi:hypothetical protein